MLRGTYLETQLALWRDWDGQQNLCCSKSETAGYIQNLQDNLQQKSVLPLLEQMDLLLIDPLSVAWKSEKVNREKFITVHKQFFTLFAACSGGQTQELQIEAQGGYLEV